MYGLINAAVRELIVSRYGLDVWGEVARTAAPDIPSFDKMAPYPDQLTTDLIAAACRITSTTPDQFLDALGELWVGYTESQGYAPMFEIAGDSLHDFLLCLDTLHARVGRSFPRLKPPMFHFDQLADHGLRMHYLSERQGLCPMIPGLLRGLSKRFDTLLTVQEETCARHGAAHCQFLIGFPMKGH